MKQYYNNKMSEQNENIINNFKQNCLKDLRDKQVNLQQYKNKCLMNIQTQKQQKIEQLSKILVNLEDQILKCLRQKIKYILTIQMDKIDQQLLHLQQQISYAVEQQKNQIERMIRVIEKEQYGSNKLLGKIAEGKIQHQHKQFLQQLLNLNLFPCTLNFDIKEIQLLIQDIQEILHLKYPKKIIVEAQNQSKISVNQQKNVSANRMRSNSRLTENKSGMGISRINQLKNQSAISIYIQEQPTPKLNTISIQEYKETKTLKKMKKIQNEIKRKELSPQKDVQSLARMALQRKRLLKQIE